MRILFFSHYFPPEVNAPANRTYEHCREWVAAGHDVHVITCVPSHPLGVPLKVLEKLELLLYARAREVVCVSEAFVANLVGRGVPAAKISFVPNGVNTATWTAGRRAEGRARLGAGDRDIIVSYIGTVGMAHNIGTVLEAARLLAPARRDIRFVVVGDGAERETLVRRAREEGLDNGTFTGLVPRSEIPDYLAASDVSLVTLKPSALFKTVLPSKMFESMAAACP